MAIMSEAPLARGLEGVVVAETAVSDVDGRAGRLVYRGYDAPNLAERWPFEAVWYLLCQGSLPSDQQLAAFRQELSCAGALAPTERNAVSLPFGGDQLAAIRTALSLLASRRNLRPWLYRDHADVRAEAMGLAAALPSIIPLVTFASGAAASARHSSGSYAANYLAQIPGARTDAAAVAALDRYLSLTADHGLNASTFAVRVVASTGADVGAALVAGVAALSGPLHGGAPTGVLEMLDRIGAAERAPAWLEQEILAGRRIMGFGHRVYRTEDPRARSLKAVALAHGGPRATLAAAVEEAATEALRRLKPDRELYPNVEFWAAVVLEQCGIPRSLFTATFACSRIAGWTAHLLEQVADNRIMRPAARYVGPVPSA